MLENKPSRDIESDPVWLFDILDIHKSYPVAYLKPLINIYQTQLFLLSALPGSKFLSSLITASLRLCSVNHFFLPKVYRDVILLKLPIPLFINNETFIHPSEESLSLPIAT